MIDDPKSSRARSQKEGIWRNIWKNIGVLRSVWPKLISCWKGCVAGRTHSWTDVTRDQAPSAKVCQVKLMTSTWMWKTYRTIYFLGFIFRDILFSNLYGSNDKLNYAKKPKYLSSAFPIIHSKISLEQNEVLHIKKWVINITVKYLRVNKNISNKMEPNFYL